MDPPAVPSARQRMSDAKLGKPRSADSVQKMVNTRRAGGTFTGNRPRPVTVHGVRYASRTAAAAALGITPQAVSIAVRRRRPGFNEDTC